MTEEGVSLSRAAKAFVTYFNEMDIPSQLFVRRWGYAFISAATFAAFLVGFATRQFANTVFVWAAATAFALVAFVPAWPWFHRRALLFAERPKEKSE